MDSSHLCLCLGLRVTTDKQRFEKLGHEVTRLRTKVALDLYQEMSDLAYLREQQQVRLDGVTKKIEMMEQRIFELEHFKLVGTTLNLDGELRVDELLKFECLEEDNIYQNDDDNDGEDGLGDDELLKLECLEKDNIYQNDDDNDGEDEVGDDDEEDEFTKRNASFVNEGNRDAITVT
eukprot:9781789-Ditylum_brightwellii.AAC.1